MLATRSAEQHPEVHAFGCYQKKKVLGQTELILVHQFIESCCQNVFIAVWRFALAGGENNYNNMA